MLRKLFRNRILLTGTCEELGLPLSVVLLISGELQDSHPLHLLAQQLSPGQGRSSWPWVSQGTGSTWEGQGHRLTLPCLLHVPRTGNSGREEKWQWKWLMVPLLGGSCGTTAGSRIWICSEWPEQAWCTLASQSRQTQMHSLTDIIKYFRHQDPHWTSPDIPSCSLWYQPCSSCWLCWVQVGILP